MGKLDETTLNQIETMALEDTEREIETKLSQKQYINFFAKQLHDIKRSVSYNPDTGNRQMKLVNVQLGRATQDEIAIWLESPDRYEEQLRELSLLLEQTVVSYKRSLHHFSTLLSYNYNIYPMQPVPTDEAGKALYLKERAKALDYLRKFRPKEQLQSAFFNALLTGGQTYYVRESKNYIDLQILPQEYVTITGRGSLGWLTAFDMSFFDQVDVVGDFAPEFREWYEAFCDAKTDQERANLRYVSLDPRYSVTFAFNDIQPILAPVLQGSLPDALYIKDYKELIRAKIQLDNHKLILQEIPTNNHGKPTLDDGLVSANIDFLQSVLPTGLITASTLLKPHDINLANGSSKNNASGIDLATNNTYANTGISSSFYGNNMNKNAMDTKIGLQMDALFAQVIYPQFERFLTSQVMLRGGKYKFGVYFFGNEQNRQDEIKNYQSAITFGAPPQHYLSFFQEPYQWEYMLDEANTFNLRDKMIPTLSSYQNNGDDGDAGRPTTPDSEKTDSAILTDAGGYNEVKS